MRARRNALRQEERCDFSRRICGHIASDPRILQAKTVFAYAPIGTEADIFPLLQRWIAEGKTVALPRVTGAGEMKFFAVQNLEALAVGTFGVREPDASWQELPPEAADVILVPGMAFSPLGDRIGYGGGYYDRYLPRCRGWRVMCAFACQEADFTGQAHDVKMHAAATQDGIREFPAEV